MWRGRGPDAIPALQELTGVEKERRKGCIKWLKEWHGCRGMLHHKMKELRSTLRS